MADVFKKLQTVVVPVGTRTGPGAARRSRLHMSLGLNPASVRLADPCRPCLGAQPNVLGERCRRVEERRREAIVGAGRPGHPGHLDRYVVALGPGEDRL